MLWVGEVEDATSIDNLIPSASTTGKPIPDFENHDFKIASGLKKIRTGNFTKQVTTAEGKAQSEKRSFTGRHIAWMSYEFFKVSGDNKSHLVLSKVIETSIQER